MGDLQDSDGEKLVQPRDAKFGHGGTLVSSVRVTAPIVIAGQRGKFVFSVVPSRHLPLLIGRDLR